MAGPSKISQKIGTGLVPASSSGAVNLRATASYLLFGSTKKRVFTGTILFIISFLIYIRNKKTGADNIRLREEREKKKVLLHLDRERVRVMWMPYFSNESRS